MQHDLVLLLGDRGAVHRVVEVRIRDRLALDADLLALDRDRLGDVLGDDVLAQAGAAGLPLRRADAQLLFGARHRAGGLGAADVVTDDVAPALGGRVARAVGLALAAALGKPRVRARLAVVEAVVAVQPGPPPPGGAPPA